MTQPGVLLNRPLSIGIAAFLGPVNHKSCRPAEQKQFPKSGRKRNTGGSKVLHGVSSERIGLEVMRQCKQIHNCHNSDLLSL